MRCRRRPAGPLLALLAVLGLAALGLAVLGPAGPAAAGDDSASSGGRRADRVLVIGVPGLAWADLDPARTPALWSLADHAALGDLSVRAARATTCLLDGWASLGAGNRARFPGPSEAIPPEPTDDAVAPPAGASLSYCGQQEQVAALGLDDPSAQVARVAADRATARFGADPGALGAAVGCATVLGRAASLAVAGPVTALDLRDGLPATTAETTPLLTGCPLTLVSLDQLTDAGTAPAARQEALAGIDAQVGRLAAATEALPGDTLLLVAGLSEVNGGRPQLHVALAAGAGLHGGWLTSASTGRVRYVQLIDLAPTVLRALGVQQPASMNGQPVTATADRAPLPEALAQLHEDDTRAVTHYRSTGPAFWTLVVVDVALLAAGVGVLGASSRVPTSRGAPARALLRAGCLAAAALPVATYLAGLLPWEDAGSPRAALLAAVLGADLVVATIAGLGPWRRSRTGAPLAVLGVTLGTLVADVLTGSHLEFGALLGYDAIVAGRFVGYGNLTFGLFSVSALLLTAAGTAAYARRSRSTRLPTSGDGAPQWRSLLPVLVAGSIAVVLLGAPSSGRDFGGVLAAVPGFGVLAMLLAGIRVTVLRLSAVLAAGVAVVAVVAGLDWLRPADRRSHLGRFVAQILDGQAWTVVQRKGQANLSILLGSALSWMLPVALVAAVWLLRPGGPLRSRSGRGPAGLPPGDARVLRAGLTAAALSLAVGAAVNDSGVAVPATAATLLVPLLVWLAAVDRPGPAGIPAGRGDTRLDPRWGRGPC